MIRILVYSLVVSFSATPALAQLQSVDPKNRASVVSFWDNVYQGSSGIAHGWTGEVGGCYAGSIAQEYRDAGLLRAQYFRAMAGLPTTISFHPTSNAKCQAAALMMASNNTISHTPPPSWTCYTVEGAEAAGKSNLAIGYSSVPAAMDAWIIDNGINSVGHRRWILYPPQEVMGIGEAFSGSRGSQVMWVIGSPGGGFGPRPSSPEWVAWPPQGFVPYRLVPGFWSFSYNGADFGSATVTMTRGATPISVTLEPLQNGYGDNTLVWTPAGLPGGAPGEDITYSVTLENVMISGSPRSFTYDVTVIDPSALVPVRKTTWGAIKNLYQVESDPEQ